MNAKEQNPPNILFLFPDQWRWDWIGSLKKTPVRTPHLDTLVRRGMLFEQARVNCPLCAPSRASLATANRFHNSCVVDNYDELNPALPNLFKHMRDAGYQVLTSGKSDLHTVSENFTADGWHPYLEELGFTSGCDFAGKWRGVSLVDRDRPEAYVHFLKERGQLSAYIEDMKQRDSQRRSRKEYRLSSQSSPLPEDATIDAFCGQQAESLLRGARSSQPWLLWVNFPGPHEPFDPPASYLEAYGDTTFPNPVGENTPREDHAGIRRNYAAMISLIDDWIGRLMQAIEDRGEMHNTLILFASDHGELLGDHANWYKTSPYEASVHVPMILAGPGVPQGARSSALLELIDIGPTLLELAGATPFEKADGRSLTRLLVDPAAQHRDVSVSAMAGWRMLFDGRHKWIENKDGTGSLYDLLTDPDELNNLVDHSDQKDRIQAMQSRLNVESPWFPGEHGYRPG